MYRPWLVTVLFVVGAVLAERTSLCPKACSCRWKDGKQTVVCSASGLRAVPEDLESGTQVLDLSENPLVELPAAAFRSAGLVHLQKILLADCQLRRVDDDAFAGLTNLVHLDLSRNALTALPSRSFPAIAALRDLKLTGNPIGRVGAHAFAAVPGLVNLDLSDCQIGDIEPAAFDPLRILEGLKLSGNRLRELQERTVVALGQVHNVELHANPWQCDCRLRPMRNWLRRNNIPYPVPPSCHGPPRVAGKTFRQLRLDEFACPPRPLPMVHHVTATADENATLTCRVGGVPQPRFSWFWRGRRVDNDTRLAGGRRVTVVEEGRFKRVSRLVIDAVRGADASADFQCVAVNAAGDARANFTLTVGARRAPPTPLGVGQIVGIVVGLLLLGLVVAAALVALARSRRAAGHDDKPKPPAGSVNGHAAAVGVETAPDGDDVNPVRKPPRLTELGYPPRYSTSSGSLIESSVFVRAPDVLPEPPPPPAAPGLYGGAAPFYAGGVTGNPLADDSYELRQLPSTSDSDPDRMHPATFGYPADFGLPMPEMGSPTASDRLPEFGSPPRVAAAAGLAGRLAEWPEPRFDVPPGATSLRRASFASEPDTPLDSSRDSRAELSTSHDSVDAGARRRPWQMGVPVLPPLPLTARVGSVAGTDV